MKKIDILFLLIFSFSLVLIIQSCDKDDSCSVISCNNGILNDEFCICDCQVGYLGSNCEVFDTTKVQTLLNDGLKPMDLVNGNVPLDSLYGKTYKGGYIFYIDIDDEVEGIEGMVASKIDQSNGTNWGCSDIDIMGLNNVISAHPIFQPETDEGARIGDGSFNTTAIVEGCLSNDGIAAKICFDLVLNDQTDWFLPSRGELTLMYKNLYLNGLGGFESDVYWSSTEGLISNIINISNNTWVQHFSNGIRASGSRTPIYRVRAALAF